MKRRGGSLSVSSLCFYSIAAGCPLWQERIMRREEGRYHRDEDEGTETGEKLRVKKRE